MNRSWLLLLLAFTLTPIAWAEDEETSNIHAQATTITQGHGSLNSPYQGANSLSGHGETKTSFTTTLYLGKSLWKDGAVYLDPEVTAGEGISQTHGVAGFPNGEVYRVSTPGAKISLARLYFEQTFGLGGEQEVIEGDQNLLATRIDKKRLTFVTGRFSLGDFFDINSYSHDPRTQFLNWSLMDNGAWDYAADTKGYTWGFYLEYNQPSWAIRAATVLEPKEANGLDMDLHLWVAYADNVEFEYRYLFNDHPGKIRWLTYLNRADMGSYRDAITNPVFGNDVTLTRQYRYKYGFGLNLEQELTSTLGSFLRMGWNDGSTETWNFTEIDKTVSLGLSLKGTAWKREHDVVGLAGILNGLSKDHADYLSAGGYGFLIGDGRLNYAPEEIIETYYLYKALPVFGVTADFQYIAHPGYNADRGPAAVFSARLHYEI